MGLHMIRPWSVPGVLICLRAGQSEGAGGLGEGRRVSESPVQGLLSPRPVPAQEQGRQTMSRGWEMSHGYTALFSRARPPSTTSAHRHALSPGRPKRWHQHGPHHADREMSPESRSRAGRKPRQAPGSLLQHKACLPPRSPGARPALWTPRAWPHAWPRARLVVNGCGAPSKAPLRTGSGKLCPEAAVPSKITPGGALRAARPRTDPSSWQGRDSPDTRTHLASQTQRSAWNAPFSPACRLPTVPPHQPRTSMSSVPCDKAPCHLPRKPSHTQTSAHVQLHERNTPVRSASERWLGPGNLSQKQAA